MKVMYIRVSSDTQSILRQQELGRELGIEKYFIDEGKTGANTNRQGLKDCLDFLRNGDTLYVADLSRLSRSVKDLLSIVEKLKEKEVSFISVKEAIDTTTPIGMAILSIFGSLYELELSNIRERQRMGIEATKKYHPERYAGRKKIEIDKEQFIAMCRKVDEGIMTARELQKALSISPQTYYRRREEFDI